MCEKARSERASSVRVAHVTRVLRLSSVAVGGGGHGHGGEMPAHG
jgi:hypothetical protein